MRPLSLISGLVACVVATCFLLRVPFVVAMFPWNLGYPADSQLSSIFIGSILFAIGLPTLWIGWKGEVASAFGGAIDLVVTFAGVGIFSMQLYLANNNRESVLYFGVFSLISVVILAAIAWQTRKLPMNDQRPIPLPVRLSFGFFVLALLIAGGALIFKTNNIFPWNINAEVRVIYGWIFLGAMCYFLFALLRPHWGNAQGQLLGFLAYDLVLIVPFVQHFSTVSNQQRLSLTIYVGVLIYSGIVAFYYLFINRETRLWNPVR
jgi:hypothetical protein